MPRSSKAKKGEDCCGSGTDGAACCRVDAIITVDARGQMVLPKEVRKKAGIKPWDKFALVCIQMGDKVCCISIVKVDELAEIVEDRLGPVMGVMFKQGRSQK